MTVFRLLCCILVLVFRINGSGARADQGAGDGGLDHGAEEGEEGKVEVFLKSLEETLEEILDDLKVIDEEEEKNHIESDVADTPWMKPCVLRELTETTEGQPDFEKTVQINLNQWNYCLKKWMAYDSYANWNYITNLTEVNQKKSTKAKIQFSKWQRQLSQNAQQLHTDSRLESLDADTRRQVRLFAQSSSPKNNNDVSDLNSLRDDMEAIYGTAKLGKLSMEPDLAAIMAHSRDPQKLLNAWKGWRDVTGPKLREKYSDYVRLLNIGASDNGYADYSQAWMEDQFDQTENLEETAENLWQEVKPLYEQLHAYVRRKLYNYYKEKFPQADVISEFGAIPAHLLGNMWAQEWANIYDIVKPYPEVDEPNYDMEMEKQKYNVDRLFSMAEEFYTSIGLFEMTDKFKQYSMFVRPPPEEKREVVCHASAEDFYTKDDFRIKMCTVVNIEDFKTIHHEMGHIEYFMAYENQPTVYRNGANSAFHEAVGDTIALSVMSRKHLETIGLLKKRNTNLEAQRKSDINYLMKRALAKIAFLPFGYMIDKWRWAVFRGDIRKDNYNKKWWQLRHHYQGLVPPIARSENDFDPGAKYHIPSNSPYICYFVSFIIQFQFYEAMCNASGHEGELYNCDFYQSKQAGDLLRNALSLGKSVPWQDAMQALTGTPEISAKAIKTYFEPLTDWLKMENEKASRDAGRNVIGWGNDKIKMTKDKPHHLPDDIEIILDELVKHRKLNIKN